MKETIKLMADYECFPLWKRGENGTINLDPDNLPLSAETKSRLTDWAEWYDSTLNPDDPASSGFVNKADEKAFEEEGDSLCKALLKELKETYNMVYFSESVSEQTEFQRENTNTERRGEAPALSGNSARKRETDTISSDLQRIYKEISGLTIAEKMILVSKMLPELSREFEDNVNSAYRLKRIG